MYKDYISKSKFFKMAESVEDGIGVDTTQPPAYVTIKKSIKNSDWYKDADDATKACVEELMNTDHNIRFGGFRSTPLAGNATADGEERVPGREWAVVYDEVAMGLRGVTLIVPYKYLQPVETGANRIPKIPDSWKYKGSQIHKPVEVRTNQSTGLAEIAAEQMKSEDE